MTGAEGIQKILGLKQLGQHPHSVMSFLDLSNGNFRWLIDLFGRLVLGSTGLGRVTLVMLLEFWIMAQQ